MTKFKKNNLIQKNNIFGKISLLILILFSYSEIVFSQELSWARHLKGAGTVHQAIDNDIAGNQYIIASAGGSVDLGTTVISSNGRANGNIFYAKYDPNGALIFGHIVGGNGTDTPLDIAVDTDGSFYIVASGSGGPGRYDPNSLNETVPNCSNPSACKFAYLIKYNADGTFAWIKETRRFGDRALITYAVEVTSDGVYVVGQNLSLQKFNKNNGNIIWTNDICGTDDSPDDVSTIGFGLAISSDRVYITGSFRGLQTFGRSNNITLNSNNGSGFIAAYNVSNGNYIIALQFNGEGRKVAFTNTNHPIIVGTTNNNTNILLRQYNNFLSLTWSKNIGNTDNNEGRDISIDNQNNIHVTGYFNNTVDFGNGNIITESPNIASYGIQFYAKFNSSGTCVLAKKLQITNVTNIINDPSSSITTVGDDVYLAGEFYGTIELNLNASCPSSSFSSFISTESFIVKYIPFSTPNLTIGGNPLVCTSGSTFTLNGVPSGATVTWQASSNVSPSSGTGSVANVYAVGSGAFNITFTVTFCNGVTQNYQSETGWVGEPPAPNQITWYDYIWNGNGGIPTNPPTTIYISPWGNTYIDVLTAAQITVPISVAGFEWQHDGVPLSGNGVSNVIALNTEGPGFFRVRTYNACGESVWLQFNYNAVFCYNQGNCSGGGGFGGRVSFYPNPVQDELVIESDKNWVKAELYNKFNQKVAEKTLNKKERIKMSHLPEGIYFLHLLNDKGEKVKKQISLKK